MAQSCLVLGSSFFVRGFDRARRTINQERYCATPSGLGAAVGADTQGGAALTLGYGV